MRSSHGVTPQLSLPPRGPNSHEQITKREQNRQRNYAGKHGKKHAGRNPTQRLRRVTDKRRRCQANIRE